MATRGTIGQRGEDVLKIGVVGESGSYVLCVGKNKTLELYDRGNNRSLWTVNLSQFSVSQVYAINVNDLDNPPAALILNTSTVTKGYPSQFGGNSCLVLQHNIGNSIYRAQLAFGFGSDKIAIRRKSGSTQWTDWKYVALSQVSVSLINKNMVEGRLRFEWQSSGTDSSVNGLNVYVDSSKVAFIKWHTGMQFSVSRSMGELPSTNLDEIKSSGVYQIVDNVANGAPSSANRWGFLIVFSASPNYVMQVIFGDASGTVFFRDLWGTNGWRSWRKMVAENAQHSVSRVQFAQEGTVFRVSYTADDGVLQLSITGTPVSVWFDKKRGIGIWDSNEKKNYVCRFVEQHSVSPLKTFFSGDKSSVTLTFAYANHSSAFMIIDNNGAPGFIYLDCMNSESKALAGKNFGITFPDNKTAVIKTTNWSFGVVMTPDGANCSISVAQLSVFQTSDGITANVELNNQNLPTLGFRCGATRITVNFLNDRILVFNETESRHVAVFKKDEQFSVSRMKFAGEEVAFQLSYTNDGLIQLSVLGTPLTVWFSKSKGIGIWDSSEHMNYTCNFDTIKQHSVSHIDNDISLRKAYLRNTSVLHLTGTDHQSYLMMSIHGICLIVSQGSQDPTVAKLSGVDVTAKRGSANNILDVTFKNGGVTALIISPSDFTVTVSQLIPYPKAQRSAMRRYVPESAVICRSTNLSLFRSRCKPRHQTMCSAF